MAFSCTTSVWKVYCVFVFVVYAAASAVFVKDAVKDPVRASAAVNVIAITLVKMSDLIYKDHYDINPEGRQQHIK